MTTSSQDSESPQSNGTPPPPSRPPGAVRRAIGAICCGCEGSNGGNTSASAANKVLPSMGAPSANDYLEIRPHRRIRVIHLYPYQTQDDLKLPGQEARDPPRQPPAPLLRKATTISRADERDETDSTLTSERKKQIADDTSDEDEDYWFENAAPRRLPIQPPRPSPAVAMQSRIFNKFEPQGPPRIPGIKPPRSQQAQHGGSSAADNEPSSVSISPMGSGGQRLQRKVILPNADIDLDDEEDEDLVHELPDDALAIGPQAPPSPTDRDDKTVPTAVAEMSDMVISITADATESRKTQQEEEEGTEQPALRANSPVPDEKSVESTPDPQLDEGEGGESDAQSDGADSAASTVVASAGALGGLANVAFEAEETGQADERDGHEANSHGAENAIPMQQLPSLPDLPPTLPHLVSDIGHYPLVFFIHGVGGSASTWSSQIDYFSSRGYEVVAPDLLGHGFSSAPDNAKCYTFNKLFRDVLTIFDHYVGTGEGRRCAVVAHSYGSSFAAALARTRPSAVSMLLLLASGGPTPLAPPPVLKQRGLLPACIVSCFVKPFLRCGFRRQKKYNPRGKAIRFQEAFDVPNYVFKHIMAGQSWPEGKVLFVIALCHASLSFIVSR